MKYSLVLILVLTFSLLISCRLSQKLGEETSDITIGNMVFSSKERLLSKLEIDTGLRICSALKKKREFFNSLNHLQEQFSFEESIVDCQGNSFAKFTFPAFISNQSSLEYVAQLPLENYFRDVVTDRSGVLDDLCVSMLSAGSVSNTIKLGGAKYTVNFLVSEEGYDRFDFKKDTADVLGNFNLAYAESLLVINGANQALVKFFGVEKERTRYTSCGDKKVKVLKQTWKGALTNF